jgi:26S proteasome regulatory subunit N13
MPSGTKLLSFRAGKMNMSGTTVTADPTKGLIELYRDPDQMVYFVWRSRASNNVAPSDELIVVAGDYTWKRVHQCKSVSLVLLMFSVSAAPV